MAIPIIEELEKLRILLNASGVERTKGLAEIRGNDCAYYKRSLDLFIEKDYKQIVDQLEKVGLELRKIERNFLKG